MISKQQIKYIRSLHQKKYREQFQVYLAEGAKLVNEILELIPEAVQYLLYTSKSLPLIDISRFEDRFQAIEVKSSEFEILSTQKSPQGILAVVRQPETSLIPSQDLGDLTLALDSIRDPGNLGTLIRLADWFGIKNIICSEDTVECYNPKVIQASMGAILRVCIHYTSLADYVKEAGKNQVCYLYGTSMSGTDLYTISFKTPAIILLGNESNGVDPMLSRSMHENVYIPNFNLSESRSESLNVSIAAGIICAEFRRQNG